MTIRRAGCRRRSTTLTYFDSMGSCDASSASEARTIAVRDLLPFVAEHAPMVTMRTSQTRQGLATAAVRLFVRFGFEDLLESATPMELSSSADDVASQRVAEKVGVRLRAASRMDNTVQSRMNAAADR